MFLFLAAVLFILWKTLKHILCDDNFWVHNKTTFVYIFRNRFKRTAWELERSLMYGWSACLWHKINFFKYIKILELSDILILMVLAVLLVVSVIMIDKESLRTKYGYWDLWWDIRCNTMDVILSYILNAATTLIIVVTLLSMISFSIVWITK
ncbi:MAG: hypothetical protein WCQ53_07710 [bacterium]